MNHRVYIPREPMKGDTKSSMKNTEYFRFEESGESHTRHISIFASFASTLVPR